jgi:hypothetical protein
MLTSEIECVTIPAELLEYKKTSNSEILADKKSNCNFGVKIIKNQNGEIERTDYYTNYGDLIKSIYYKGSSISVIKHYRNQLLFSEERYSDGKLISKGIYNNKGVVISGIAYKYNRENRIISIEKSVENNLYMVEYGYDELDRVNSRKVSLNNKVINEQTYRFDILDRIVEYKDFNQKIDILQISKNNELISYKITDRIGNEMLVVNKFIDNLYKRTDISLNNHQTSVIDKSYVDNIMLKKPYTTEDDLDFIIANLYNSSDCSTKRTSSADISDDYIDKNIQYRVLPISIRKRLLYNTVVNL